MSLRSKLLIFFALAVAAAAGVTAWNAERYAAGQYQQADQQRSAALVTQFRRELSEREAEVTTSIQTIADAESTVRMALDLSGPQGDPSIYAGDARGLASARQLDFLELATTDGTLISSAQWPDHIGTKETWLTHENDWNQRGAFLSRVELPDRMELGLIAVRMVHAGNLNLYIVGGQRLDAGFLRTLSLPEGMRALFYRNLQADFAPANLSDSAGAVDGAESFAPLIQSMQKQAATTNGLNGPDAPGADGAPPSVSWSADSGSTERFVAVPLTGKQGEFLGALLLGSPQGELAAFKNNVGGAALLVAAAGLMLAIFLSWWIAARVAQPLQRLTEGIGEVAAGDWDAQVETGSVREVQQPIAAFNKMTKQLADERAGQVARERAAAWRQLAGQLAAELKTLLPPLESAVEGLARPAEQSEEDAEGFTPEGPEQTATVSLAMRQTLETLAACAGKLGEFAALPVPRLEAVKVNDTVRAAVQLFEPQFSAIGRPPVTPELYLDERAGEVRADPVLIRKVFENLLLFVIEDMPAGGTFTIYTRRQEDMAHITISHSGATAPRKESRERKLERTARVSGLGLSLATVQSIVSSHGGKISIETAPLAGTTFYLDWPVVASKSGATPQPMTPVFSDIPQQPEPAVRRREADQPPRAPAELQPAQKQEAQRHEEPHPEERREVVAAQPVFERALGLAAEQSPVAKLERTPEPAPEAMQEAVQEPAQKSSEEAAPIQAQQMEPPQNLPEQPEPSPEPEPQVESTAENPAAASVPAMASAAADAMEAPEPEVAAAGSKTRSLAAVIEEVYETPAYAAKVAEVFAGPNKNAAEYVKELDRASGRESGDSLIEVSVVNGWGAVGGRLSGEDLDDVLSGWYVDSTPQLFGVPVPTSMLDTLERDNRQNEDGHNEAQNETAQGPTQSAQDQTAQLQNAEPDATQHQTAQLQERSAGATAAEIPAQATPEPVDEPAPAAVPEAPAKTSEESAPHVKQDQRPILTYSPLTYRW